MTEQPNLFPLKLLVIFLGLALVGGIVFVLCAITTGVKNDMQTTQCADATVHLQSKGTLTSIIPQGKNVQIIISSPKDSKVLTVDRCTGAIVQTLTAVP